ncbi:LPD38 domain-containing protein [uncultured Pelagimonas sp.]|uniref:LPD38 domain-containing protein n=1 Tax=uncultured Pelagimonas sp. TaxID=1618102 RepID=UPI002604452E|nr:LPD38 domain-containing protein [uncultured Pelagimonas sp.]
MSDIEKFKKIRGLLPELDHLSDGEFAEKVRTTALPDMDKVDFYHKVGLQDRNPSGFEDRPALGALAGGLGGSTQPKPAPLSPTEQPVALPNVATQAPAMPRAPGVTPAVSPPAGMDALPSIGGPDVSAPRSPMQEPMAPIGGPAISPAGGKPALSDAIIQASKPEGPRQKPDMSFGMGGFNPDQAALARRQAIELGGAEIAGRNDPVAPEPVDPNNPEGTAVGRAVERGVIRVKQSVPAYKASRAASAIREAREGYASQGGYQARADSYEEEAAALEAELSVVAEADPEAAEQLQEEIDFLRSKAKMERIGADTPTIKGNQKRLDAVATKKAVTGSEALVRLQELSKEAQALPMSAGAENVKKRLAAAEDTWSDTFNVLMESPLETGAFLAEVGLESSPQLAASAAAGIITKNPGVASAILGGGAMTSEYGSSIAEYLQEKRIKINSVEDAAAVLKDPDLMRDAEARGLKRGVVIAAAEALGMKATAVAQGAMSPVKGAIAGAGIQATAGGGGEAAARAAAGQEFSAQEVIIEALAEVFTAPAEIATAAYSKKKPDAQQTPPMPPQAGVPPLDEAAPNVKTPTPDLPNKVRPEPLQPETPPSSGTADAIRKATEPAPAPEPTPEPTPVSKKPAADTEESNPEAFEEEAEEKLNYVSGSDGNLYKVDRDETGKAVFSAVGPDDGGAATASSVPDDAESRIAEIEANAPKKDLQKKPFTYLFKRMNFGVKGENAKGIHPDGPIGQILKAGGMTSRNSPGVFSRKGSPSADNIPVSEIREHYPEAPDDGNGYVEPQWLADKLLAEHGGTPQFSADQYDLVQHHKAYDDALAEVRTGRVTPEADTYVEPTGIPHPEKDMRQPIERLNDIRTAVISEAHEDGIDLDPASLARVTDKLDRDGGEVIDAIWSDLSNPDFAPEQKGALVDENPIPFPEPGNDQAPAGRADPASSQGRLDQGATSDARPEGDTRTEDRGQEALGPVQQNAPVSDGKPASEQTDAGEQTLIPGVEPVTDKAKAEVQMSKPKRGGNAPVDDGLFDTGARDQTDMFSDAGASPKPKAGKKRTAADNFRENYARKMKGGGNDLRGNPNLSGVADYADWLGNLPDADWAAIEGHFGNEHNPFLNAASIDEVGAQNFLQGKIDDAGKKTVKKKPVSDQAGNAQNQEPVKKPDDEIDLDDIGFSADELAELDAIGAAFKKKLDGTQLNAGLDPELIGLAYKAASIYIKRGVRDFSKFAKAFVKQTGLQMDTVARYLRDAYNSVRDDMEDDGADVSDMDDSRAVRTKTKELQDEFRDSGNDLEQGQEPTDGVGQADVPNDGRSTERSAGPSEGPDQGRSGGDRTVSDAGTAPARAPRTAGDSGRTPGTDAGVTRSPEYEGSPQSGVEGTPDAEPGAIVDAHEAATPRPRGEPDANAQQLANQTDTKPKFGDPDSIDAMLPALHPEQRDDVLKIEERFFAPKDGRKAGYGYMNTNGTGTGKTYVAAGLAKRFYAAGKQNILIMTKRPTFKTFKEALDALGVPYNEPKDTDTSYEGVNLVTINGALGKNKALADIEWDLIIPDETNYISENMKGDILARGDDFRGLALHPDHLVNRANMHLHEQITELEKVRLEILVAVEAGKNNEADQLENRARSLEERISKERQRLVSEYKKKPRPHVAMFSATPFTTPKSLEYGEGFLFDFEKIDATSYNQPNGREKFMIQNFGYRMRYNKLTEPENMVDMAMMARRFNERLRREGVMDGRVLEVDHDYQRMWLDVDGGVGTQIDAAFKLMHEDKHFRPLYTAFNKSFSHHKRIQLLEAIKAQGAIENIRADLALGRKVVVFHDRQYGGGFNPFDTLEAADKNQSAEGLEALWSEFQAANPWVSELDFTGMKPARDALIEAFPNAAIVGSGVSAGKSLRNQTTFNMDDSGVDVVITQSESGKDGWSGHDTTGKHQRAIHNLGIPNRPTTLIQTEGRIYRVGQASDAIFRYYNTGTQMEKRLFADVISGRADMAESLAMGDQARGLRKSIISGFQSSATHKPKKGEGKGGKEADHDAQVMDPFQEAKALFFAQQKGRQNHRGADYFATPEPLGLRMVEWLDLNAGERALEPSAGHGAIARFFPDTVHQTAIEPSYNLQADLSLNAPNIDRRIDENFETLPVVNKFHGIAMNPPFGRGGKLAMEHLKKAAGHLYDGGRIVAIIPRGPSADKYLAMATQSMEGMGVYMTASIDLPAVTFKRAGTSVQTKVVVFDKQMTEDGKRYVENLLSYETIGGDTLEQFVDNLEGMLPATGPRHLPPVDEAAELEIPTAEKVDVVSVVDDKPIVRPKRFTKDKEEHLRRVELAAELGGSYVTRKKDKEGWGFVFPDREKANAFASDLNGKARKAGTVSDGFKAEKPRTMYELRNRLDALGLEDVDLTEMDGSPRDDLGRFRSREGNMEILLRATFGGTDTLNHEAIHALRAMNLFTKEEWAALEAKAPGWIERYGIDERYAGESKEVQTEEAIAEAFAEWARTKGSGAGKIARSFEKVRRFFSAMLDALRRSGSVEAADVFNGVDSGVVGRRARTGHARAVDLARKTTGAYADADPGLFRAIKDSASERGSWWQTTRVLFQDAFAPWKNVDRALGLKGERSTYDRMSLVESKAGVALDKMERDYQEPIAKLMGQHELSQTAVGAYLIDRHADERDERIARTLGRTEGSGLTQTDRAAIRSELAKNNADQMRALKEIGELVDKWHEDMIEVRVRAGLLSKQEAASWREYDHYVPLKGFEEVEGMTVTEQLQGERSRAGKGNSVSGRETRAAKGRAEVGAAKFDEVVSNIVAGAGEALVRAHKNEVGQTFLNTVRQNKSPLWSEVKRKSRPMLNVETGVVQWMREYDFKDRNDPAVISMKEGGKEVLIRLHDAGLARAYSKIGFAQISWFARSIARPITQFRSASLTRWSPKFLATNTVRDITTGLIISQKFNAKNDARYRGVRSKIAKYYAPALYFSGRNAIMPDADKHQWDKWVREFKREGGATAFAKYTDVRTTKSDLAKRAKHHSRSKASKAAIFTAKSYFEAMRVANEATENAMRLATYRALRESGIDAVEAANAAKDITVNFNRRGEWTSEISSYAMFFNPAVQGAAFIAQNAKHLVKPMIALTALGVGMEVINQMMQGEEEEWDRMPLYMKQRNLIIPNIFSEDETAHFKMPLPYNFSTFVTAGRVATALGMGTMDPAQAFKDLSSETMTSWSPTGGVSWGTFVPDAFEPVAEVVANENNFFGSKVHYGRIDNGAPLSEQMSPSQSWLSQDIARSLNKLSGGSLTKSGSIDLHPKAVDHLIFGYTGGMGRMVAGIANEASAYGAGHDADSSAHEFSSIFYGSYDDRAAISRSYENSNNVTTKAKDAWLRAAEFGARAAEAYGQPIDDPKKFAKAHMPSLVKDPEFKAFIEENKRDLALVFKGEGNWEKILVAAMKAGVRREHGGKEYWVNIYNSEFEKTEIRKYLKVMSDISAARRLARKTDGKEYWDQWKKLDAAQAHAARTFNKMFY